ncbi:hypothetical protein CEXT_800131 [Caerostris extrusa]|uniref:Uncharacterized protein n=1 Tax=Caerostris extrusa TaxID=172846 RepID=A0AAV4TM50_CAEEX|nr:hypothetical protein CEXT_800131 [Caerostris extrusa]
MRLQSRVKSREIDLHQLRGQIAVFVESTSPGREGRKADRSIVTRSDDSDGLASTTVSVNPSITHHKGHGTLFLEHRRNQN